MCVKPRYGADAEVRRHDRDLRAVRRRRARAVSAVSRSPRRSTNEDGPEKSSRATASSIESTGIEPSSRAEPVAARARARREHDHVGAGERRLVRLDADADVDAELGQLELEPLDRAEELGGVAEPADGAEPAAELGLALDERHACPRRAAISAAFRPAGPPPTTSTSAHARRGRGLAPPLAADVGVVEAGDRQAADHAVDAALVGADAVADALAVAELVDEVGVGDHGARHRDDVAVACLERLLGDARDR